MPTKVRARPIYAKGPDRCRGMPHSLPGEVWGRSDGCGSSFPACDLRFGAEPVFQFVTVLSAARLVEFVYAGDYLFSSIAMASKGLSLMFSGRCSNASRVRMSPAFARVSSVLPSV